MSSRASTVAESAPSRESPGYCLASDHLLIGHFSICPFISGHLSFLISHSSSLIRHPSFVIRHRHSSSSFVIVIRHRHSSSFIRHLSFVICHSSLVIRHSSSVIRHPSSSLVICHLSFVICNSSSVIRHSSSVIRHCTDPRKLDRYDSSHRICPKGETQWENDGSSHPSSRPRWC
jgi:hypothetical protein